MMEGHQYVSVSNQWAEMNFAERPPSVAWEPISVLQLPGCVVWGWFKPAAAPQSVMINVPDNIYQVYGPALTLRMVMHSTGFDASQVQAWTIQGITYESQRGANPLLDQPLPYPGPQGIAIHFGSVATPTMSIAPAQSMMPMPASSTPATGNELFTLEAIATEWQSIILLETQLDAARRKLGDIQGQLSSLNRDLGSDERLLSSAQDKKDWEDARRFLRDNLFQVGRYIREYDIGVTSSAGNRKHFEEVYVQFVEPRQAFPGMEQEQLAFEQHRKTGQTLLQHMQTAHAAAARDGIQRARSVLTRIAAKVRTGRHKR
ncbi:MAG: hypothetical protein KDA52_04275 [Planctomycetaceae bacterium]|nr:hypothetical protein [Planctomycetaceae bacterium]